MVTINSDRSCCSRGGATTRSTTIKEIIGKYELETLISDDERILTYLAREVQAERTVLLKLVPPHRATPENLARLEREAQATAEVDSPHVAQVLDSGEADGYHYVAFEHVAGQSLAEALAERGQRPYELAEALAILDPIAEALDQAHERGLIHGSLNPQAIWLTEGGGVRLYGFGQVEPKPGVAVEMPVEAARYMAPEQFEPEGEIDASTDVYALGVILYEMVTGSAPFGSNMMATLAYSVMRGRPRVPSLTNPLIPENVEGIVLNGMAREKPQRYTSCKALTDALRRGMARAESTERRGVTGLPAAAAHSVSPLARAVTATATAGAAKSASGASSLGSGSKLGSQVGLGGSPASTELPRRGARARRGGPISRQAQQSLLLLIAAGATLVAIVLGVLASGYPLPSWLVKPTPTATATATPTATATDTATPTPSATLTFTPVPTATATHTSTVTPTPTETATATHTVHPKKTLKAEGTRTHTLVPTRTKEVILPTETPTPTRTPTITPTPVNYPSGNLLNNPGFEGAFSEREAPEVVVADYWEAWWQDGPGQLEGYFRRPEYKPENKWLHTDRRIREGTYAQKFFTTYGTHNAGFFQRVPVVPGGLCVFTIWVQVWSSEEDDPNSVTKPGDYRVQIGIDPTGGTDWASPNIVWSPPRMEYNTWMQLTVIAVAKEDVVTVFTRGYPEYRTKHNDSYWDDAYLREGAP